MCVICTPFVKFPSTGKLSALPTPQGTCGQFSLMLFTFLSYVRILKKVKTSWHIQKGSSNGLPFCSLFYGIGLGGKFSTLPQSAIFSPGGKFSTYREAHVSGCIEFFFQPFPEYSYKLFPVAGRTLSCPFLEIPEARFRASRFPCSFNCHIQRSLFVFIHYFIPPKIPAGSNRKTKPCLNLL